jgi:hypothetical protein
MVYQTLSYGIMNSSFGRNEGGSIYHEGVQNTDPSAVDVLYAKIEPGPEQEKYLIS